MLTPAWTVIAFQCGRTSIDFKLKIKLHDIHNPAVDKKK